LIDPIVQILDLGVENVSTAPSIDFNLIATNVGCIAESIRSFQEKR
jgi:hypothetical protein